MSPSNVLWYLISILNTHFWQLNSDTLLLVQCVLCIVIVCGTWCCVCVAWASAADPVSEGAVQHSLPSLHSGERRPPPVSKGRGTPVWKWGKLPCPDTKWPPAKQTVIMRRHESIATQVKMAAECGSVVFVEITQGSTADPELNWGELPSACGTAQLSGAQQGNSP